MKKIIKRITFGISCAFLTAVLCVNNGFDTYATDQSDVEEARKEADATKEKIEELRSELSDISGQMDQVQVYVEELNGQLQAISENMIYYQGLIAEKEAEISAKNDEINSKQQDIDAKNAELNQAQKDEQNQFDAMALRIQYMYEQGDETALDMIFSSKDISDLLGKAEYFSSITAYDRQQLQVIKDTEDRISLLLAELQNEKTELENQKSDLESQKAELAVYRDELESQQSAVDIAMQAQQAALDSLEGQQEYVESLKKKEEANLIAQEQEAARLQAAWEEEQKKYAQDGIDINEANKKKLDEIGLNGGFTWPVPGFNHISSRFGPRPSLGGYHCGMDISGVSPVTGKYIFGAPIVAAYSGTVEIARYYVNGADYGNCVQIDHGSGVETRYAHMCQIAVTEGQTVQAGDVIGYVGSTGNSTGPHLHLALIIKGSFVDPELYFTIPSY